TTVSKGTLLITNKTGYATGTGPVSVKGGTLGGTGKSFDAVTIGTATTAGVLSPGIGAKPGKLTFINTLAFNALGNYTVDLTSTVIKADQVQARGVTITSGASITISDSGTAVLTSDTVFTIVNNVATTPIAGTFNNLGDGSTIVVGNNKFRVNYEGGDGND